MPRDPATATRNDLIVRLLDHCRAMYVTGEEGPLADAIEAQQRTRGEQVTRVGDSLVVGRPRGDRPMVLLVGHLDVVEPSDADRIPRVEHDPDHGEVVVARGTSDMKAGNVVAMKAFDELRDATPYDLLLVLYAGEEGPAEGNELRTVLTAVPWLTDAALAIVLEPTDGEVQLGCLGGIHAHVVFHGRQAHSARPWQGDNAVTKAGAFLANSTTITSETTSMASRSATCGRRRKRGPRVRAGPDRDARSCTQHPAGPLHRQPEPQVRAVRSLDAGREAQLRASGSAIERRSRWWTARHQRHPTVPTRWSWRLHRPRRRADVGGKQAWTDVARFAEIGVPALNFGPGLTAQAHQRGEHVPVAAILEAYLRLRIASCSPPGRTTRIRGVPACRSDVRDPLPRPGGAADDDAVVVIDVLRAFTVVPWLFARGCSSGSSTVAAHDQALRLRETRLPDALLAGEDGGRQYPDFDLGNSPTEVRT